MRKLALGISLVLVTILLNGCGGGSSSGNEDGGPGQEGGTGQSGSEQILCLQRHPLLNTRSFTDREQAVAAFYQAKVDCKASLSALVKQAKAMEQNGIYLE